MTPSGKMPVLHSIGGMEVTPWYSWPGVQYVYGYKKTTPYPYPSIPLSRNTQCYLYLCLSLISQCVLGCVGPGLCAIDGGNYVAMACSDAVCVL